MPNSNNTSIAPALFAGIVCIGVLGFALIKPVQELLITYRDSTIEPRPQTQKVTQTTEDTLSASTLKKLINSTTYSIREIASRIVCDRALHDEGTLECLLWYITRPDHRKREKGLRALFLLCTKSGMAQLNTPRVYSAIVKSLEYCVTDVEHDPYDPTFDNWDFRDINERLCLMIAHRLILEYGASNFIQRGFIARWLAKEPWGATEDERQRNVLHCYHQSDLLSYIILQLVSDQQGEKKMRDVQLLAPEASPPRRTDLIVASSDPFPGGPEILRSFDVVRGADGTSRLQERSAEEQRLRRVHRTAMVLHDNSEPLGIDSIITSDGAAAAAPSNLSRSDLIREAERQLEREGVMANLTPRRLDDIRAILRRQTQTAERAGLEEEPEADILRELLDNEINRRMASAARAAVVADADAPDSQTEPARVDGAPDLLD